MAERSGSLHTRVLEDGRELTVYPMLFGKARLCIGEAGAPTYEDAWCYEDPRVALQAAATWDGEGDPPIGWHRHIGSGRRRPDGDPAKEYVAP